MNLEWKMYRKKTQHKMRPFIPWQDDLSGVTISPEDIPKAGGMIAINPDNPKDQRYIDKKFFEDNYEVVQ